MRIVRSFPRVIPPNRAYIVDQLERFYNQDYGYAGFQQVTAEDDIILLEWDIAIDQPNLRRFIRHCETQPDWPVTAPYHKTEDDIVHWMHFRKTGMSPHGGELWRPIFEGERDCDQVGTGIMYFPQGILDGCPNSDAGSQVLNDGLISRYLRSLPQWKPVPIMWDITVTHLH